MTEHIVAILLASTALDVLLVAGALAGGRRPGRRLLAVAAMWVGKLAALWAVGLEVPFGAVHMIYLDLVVGLPILAATYLALRRRLRLGGGRIAVAVAVLGCLGAPVGAWASFVEPVRLQVERAAVPVSASREGRGAIRVGVLSDLQTDDVGGYERRAVSRLLAERPDVIVVPGDLLQAPGTLQQDGPELRRLLATLRAPGGVYLVPGDQESPAEVAYLTRGTRMVLLNNRFARVRVRGRRLTIGGVGLAYGSPAARAVVRRLEGTPGEGDVRLLLAHRPDAALGLPPRPRTDLVVAGHTHGGQVSLPGLGPPTIASGVPREVGAGGLHGLGAGRRIYVSRGVGIERSQAPPLRVLAPPDVSVLAVGAAGP